MTAGGPTFCARELKPRGHFAKCHVSSPQTGKVTHTDLKPGARGHLRREAAVCRDRLAGSPRPVFLPRFPLPKL